MRYVVWLGMTNQGWSVEKDTYADGGFTGIRRPYAFPSLSVAKWMRIELDVYSDGGAPSFSVAFDGVRAIDHEALPAQCATTNRTFSVGTRNAYPAADYPKVRIDNVIVEAR